MTASPVRVSPSAEPHAPAAPAFLVLDRSGRCTHATHDAAALLGLGDVALVGRSLADVLPAADVLHDAIAAAVATQRATTVSEPVPGRVVPSPEGALLLLDGEPWSDAAAGVEGTRYLHAVLDTVPECIKVVARDGTLLDMNGAGLAMLEAPSRDAVIGCPVEQIVVPRHRGALRRVLASVFGGTAARAELEIVTLGGHTRRVETRAAPLRDDAGNVVAALSVTHDVSDRHADAERLRESETRFRTLAAAAPAGIALLDATGNALYRNERFAEILGIDLEQITDATWRAAMHPADLAAAERDAHAFLAGEADETTSEYRLRRADGTVRWVHSTLRRQRDADGRPTGMIAIVADVTAEKHAEAERRANDARFRQLAAAAPVGIFLGDADGRVLYANPRYEEIWELRGEAALGNGWLTRMTPEEASRLRRDGIAAFAAGAQFSSEYQIVLPDGRTRWIRGHMVLLRNAAGEPESSLGTVEDITARREAEEAEARARSAADVERARLEAVLEALPAGVIFADADGRIVRATRQARALWGGDVTAEHVDGYGRYRARLRGSNRPLTDDERALTRALRGESTPPRELELERLDGGSATVLSAAEPVRDAEGRIVGGVVVLIDVSERVRLEAQLRQAQKMEAVGQLAGGVAHDFNNLLTVINGNLEFARNDIDPDHQAQEDLAQVAQAAERARALVRQLLAFSRKQVVQSEEIDVNDVVRGAEALLRRVLGEEIAFATTLAERPAVVRADRGQLEQVLLNLAVNARDAMLTTAHGRAGTGGTLTLVTDVVRLSPREAQGWTPGPGRYVRLTVSDTGHGMDATTRAHIFEPFFTTKAVGAGTGLGLATVYGIVTQAGGAVHVDSEPGAGATFTILLPYQGGRVAAAERGGGTSLPRGRGTVLVVEDEASVRLTTRRVLERHGFAVLEARHGADALLVWREHGADIVCCVTDLRMPEMGGRELVAQIRADRPALPVVYLSGYVDRGAVEPADGFVEKPFTGEALLQAVTSVLRAPRDA
ncbi:PAS sensor protein (plasmid) [Gemmatirosa kalamazoonensis]|uniref:histidine kinase n=1 Tax=Gemmatirosa kalamazoonensis TaxID=861299 RepID=W0RW81_9BACT|nr:PAS domain S-box protein [Gemmatirosa kalamazoonensis]AHG93833.1 PAS sensor protein [Gemmatirosa kalamazoonensis]